MPLAPSEIAPTGEPPPFVLRSRDSDVMRGTAPARSPSSRPATASTSSASRRGAAAGRSRADRGERRRRTDGTHGLDGRRAARPATDPRRHDPEARSVITVAAPYAGSERAAWDAAPLCAARGAGAGPRRRPGRACREDRALRDRQRLPRCAARPARGACLRPSRVGVAAGDTAYVDDRPLAERALAARAGLGWIGKNTNLLTHERAGSWVFLGAILTLGRAAVGRARCARRCGSCTRCLTGCPTGALVAPQHDRRAALHQLPDDRASRRARCVGGGGDRRLDLRLRRVPGGLPGQRRRGRRRPAAGPAAAARRVAPADGRACLRAPVRGDRAHARGASPAAAQRDRRAREWRPDR